MVDRVEIVGRTLDYLFDVADSKTNPLHPLADTIDQARLALKREVETDAPRSLTILPNTVDHRPVEEVAKWFGALGRDERLSDVNNWTALNRYYRRADLSTFVPGVKLQILDTRFRGRGPNLSASLLFSPAD